MVLDYHPTGPMLISNVSLLYVLLHCVQYYYVNKTAIKGWVLWMTYRKCAKSVDLLIEFDLLIGFSVYIQIRQSTNRPCSKQGHPLACSVPDFVNNYLENINNP